MSEPPTESALQPDAAAPGATAPHATSTPESGKLRRKTRNRRDGSADSRWFAGLNVGLVTSSLGAMLLVMYKIDPVLLYGTRIAAGAVVLGAMASIFLLLQGVTSRSRRLSMVRFWVILVANAVLIPLLAFATWRALQHAPPPQDAEPTPEASALIGSPTTGRVA